jgi:transcriptional regulator with XRE-family HTH domain
MRVLLSPGHPEPEPPRPLLRTALGAVLRRTRQQQGRTLAAVARAARVSVPYLSELERGRKEGSSEILAAICDALGIGLADLLAEARHDLAAPVPGSVLSIADRLAPGRMSPPASPGAPQACLRAA